MIGIWPEELPRPERSSWQMQPQDARRKRQSEAGPPGYRRRFSSVARIVSMSLVLTRSEKAVFDRFFHEECQEGSLNFWMPDPTTDGWSLLTGDDVPILTGDGQPITLTARWLCAWGDQVPTETVIGIEFRKAFQIVVLP